MRVPHTDGAHARTRHALPGGIALAGALAGLLGALLLQGASNATIAAITAVAAGAILAMLADTMIPEAFERAGLFTGLIMALGFLSAFAIDRI